MAPNTPIDDDRLDAVLDELLELDPHARAHRLGLLARQEPLLAQRAARILAAEDSPRLEQALGRLADDLIEDQTGLVPGTRLGPWRVKSLLGSGGMGRVYLGERADDAFQMQVAIKVLRGELALPAEVLKHERDLLARLEHPALTRLLDGGVSDDGHVYLVMEYAAGQTLSEWLLNSSPSLERRIGLFLELAAAVAHAHRHRVVHGDISPGNVLIDAMGRVRLLDFGIAQLTDVTADHSGVAAGAMTPGYAAPERLAGAPVSVATDIYGMGVLLRFLLTDGSSAKTLTELPRRKDVDSILARANAELPQARYPDVGALARDVRNWRASRPVQARGGGRAYAMQRFMGRHGVAVAAGVLVFLTLLAASSLLLWQNRVIRGERDQARMAEARADTVLDYLVGAVGAASQEGSGRARSRDIALTSNIATITRDFAGDPSARQYLLARLADLHVRMQDYATADILLDEIGELDDSGDDALVKLRVLDARALIALNKGDLETAARLEKKAIALLRDQPSAQQGQLSELLTSRAQIESRAGDQAAAVRTLREALQLRLEISPPDAIQSVVVRNGLAVALMRAGAYNDALLEFRALVLALNSSHREYSLDAANIHNNYAATAFVAGLYDEAGPQFERALMLQSERFGPSAALAALLSNYARFELARGHMDAAVEQAVSAVAMMREYAGEESVDVQLVRVTEAIVAGFKGQHDKAADVFALAEQQLASALPPSHSLLDHVRAAELGMRAWRGSVKPADPEFDRLLTTLDTPATSRQRAELACHRSRLALEREQLTLALDSAQTCIEAWLFTQADASPRLISARFLEAEARYRQEPSAATRQQRDAALTLAEASLPPASPERMAVASVSKN